MTKDIDLLLLGISQVRKVKRNPFPILMGEKDGKILAKANKNIVLTDITNRFTK